MEALNSHINEHLDKFLEINNHDLFEIVFGKLNSENKEKYKKLLQYLFRILDNSRNQENQLNSLNIHFEKNIDSEAKSVIAELIWYYFFYTAEINENSNDINEVISNRIQELADMVSQPLIIPERDAVSERRIRATRKKKQITLKIL